MQTTLRKIIEEQISIKSLIIVVAFIALFVGYGLWTTTDTGTLIINSPAYGSQVFVDEHIVGLLKEPPDSMRLPEPSGKHSVIVSKDGYWPWTEDIEIKKHETTEIHPFIIPQKVAMESIPRLTFSNGATSANPDYAEALALFENLTTSDEIKPLAEATRIENITHADYAPGRTDVLLIAAKDGIFAVGVEKDDRPNFQPVYKGTSPSFVKAKDGTLYIKDGDSIFRVKGLGK
jgi:hypothetical protein